MNASRHIAFDRVTPSTGPQHSERDVAVEMPVAFEFNGMGYAVMMATPADLDDFAYGFAASERLIDGAADVLSIDRVTQANGILLRINLAQRCAERVVERVRHRVSESSCGLCGVENLEQALRPLPKIAGRKPPAAAIFNALEKLGAHQPLNGATGAVHAAAQCSDVGEIGFVREDVGRHNAFDKLIGAMLRGGADWNGGFALLTARCSYELVEKAVLAKCPALVTISAPTTLAIERAEQAGLALVVLARADAVLVANDPDEKAL